MKERSLYLKRKQQRMERSVVNHELYATGYLGAIQDLDEYIAEQRELYRSTGGQNMSIEMINGMEYGWGHLDKILKSRQGPQPDKQINLLPRWSEFRFRSRELEKLFDGQPRVLVRGVHIPTDTVFKELVHRLERCAYYRGGRARLWEENGEVHAVLTDWA